MDERWRSPVTRITRQTQGVRDNGINSHGKPKETEIMGNACQLNKCILFFKGCFIFIANSLLVSTKPGSSIENVFYNDSLLRTKFSAFSNVASFEENLLTILPPFQHKLSLEKLITCIDCKVYNLSNDANFYTNDLCIFEPILDQSLVLKYIRTLLTGMKRVYN
jgi:hypothetical protein